MLPRALANWSPNRQPIASSHAMNQPPPPQLRAMNTPSVAKPTVTATRPMTRPNSAGVLVAWGRSAYPSALIARSRCSAKLVIGAPEATRIRIAPDAQIIFQ